MNQQKTCTAGLLGGSFNPPHYGHLAVSRACKAVCHLDYIAWLITPRNPLKDPSIYQSLAERMVQVKALTQGCPDIHIWDIEKELQTTESVQTVEALKKLHPHTRFVWLMGADLLIELPLWPTWKAFLETIPIVIYPRPGFTQKAKESLVAQQYASSFRGMEDAPNLAFCAPPALLFLEGEEYDISSTVIRKEQRGTSFF